MPPGHAVNNGGSGRCLDDETLALLLEGALDEDEDDDVRAHLDTCEDCRSLFAEAARSADSGIKRPRTAGSIPAAPARRGKARAAATLEPGDLVAGKYRVERRIGIGGMGYVVAARHVDLDQLVALKVMRPEMLADGDAVRRFAREAKSAASLHSAHAVRIFDVGRLETGTPYIVMEYLEGLDLSSLLDKEGPLPIATAIDYLLQVCEALAEAHDLGIIHRDLKPHNMFLTRGRNGEPFVKVLDFGLAKAKGPATHGDMESAMTGTNVMLGSPFFMSPEQVHSTRDVDHRTDIWSLGATLYHLIAGVPPFLAPNVILVCAQILTESFPPIQKRRPEAPVELEALLRRCMTRSVDDRFANVGELVTALRRVRDVVTASPHASGDTDDTRNDALPEDAEDATMDATRTIARRASAPPVPPAPPSAVVQPVYRDDATVAKPAALRMIAPAVQPQQAVQQPQQAVQQPQQAVQRAPRAFAPAVPTPMGPGPMTPLPATIARPPSEVPTARTRAETGTSSSSIRSVMVLGVIGAVAVAGAFLAIRVRGSGDGAGAGGNATATPTVVVVTTAPPTPTAITVPTAIPTPTTTAIPTPTTTATASTTPSATPSATTSKPPRPSTGKPPRPHSPGPNPSAGAPPETDPYARP